MTIRKASFVVVVVAAALSGACGIIEPSSGGGFNPNKPIGSGNEPPCLIDGVPCVGTPLATTSVAVFEGDCSADPASCSPNQERFPTQDPALQMVGKAATYIVKNHSTKYTVRVRIDNPRVAGRKINTNISVSASSANSNLQDVFEEGSNAKIVYRAVAFDLSFPRGGVINAKSSGIRVFEYDQDLLVDDQDPLVAPGQNEFKMEIGFRIP